VGENVHQCGLGNILWIFVISIARMHIKMKGKVKKDAAVCKITDLRIFSKIASALRIDLPD
jgi:hypothetical protein